MGTPAWQARDSQCQRLRERLMNHIDRQVEEMHDGGRYHELMLELGSNLLNYLEKNETPKDRRMYQLVGKIGRDVGAFTVIRSEYKVVVGDLLLEILRQALQADRSAMNLEINKITKAVFNVEHNTDEVDYVAEQM
jgi:hypothetical protein